MPYFVRHSSIWRRLAVGLPCLTGGLIGAALFGGSAVADQPRPWEMWMQEPVTPVMHRIEGLHAYLTWVMAGVVVVVLALLLYVMWRFRASRNPEPARFSHNVLLETAWTLIPIAILLSVAVPSIRLLYFMDRTTEADMTLKVTGNQWYWSYEYPDAPSGPGELTFDSYLVPDEELQAGQPRLLTVDNEVVLPIDTNVRILLTASDVIHSWAVPSLGVKNDTVPGRISETWVNIEKPGTYYGQCSELCGVNHGFMPIAVHAVSKEDFAAWMKAAEMAAAGGDSRMPTVAQAVAEAATHQKAGVKLANN